MNYELSLLRLILRYFIHRNVITNENVICPSGISSDSGFDILSPISLDAPYINTRFLFNYEDP